MYFFMSVIFMNMPHACLKGAFIFHFYQSVFIHRVNDSRSSPCVLVILSRLLYFLEAKTHWIFCSWGNSGPWTAQPDLYRLFSRSLCLIYLLLDILCILNICYVLNLILFTIHYSSWYRIPLHSQVQVLLMSPKHKNMYNYRQQTQFGIDYICSLGFLSARMAVSWPSLLPIWNRLVVLFCNEILE